MKKKVLSMLLMGACFLASVSLFTSCKDYDDDIAANKTEIAALRAELTTVKSNLEASLNTERSAFETQIAALQAQMQSAIEKKADEATVKALQDQLDKLNQDYAARMAVLTTQVEAAYAAIGKLDEKADKSTVDGVITDLAVLTGKLADEQKAREAVEANLQLQLEALQKFMQEYKDANLQEQIDKLREAIGEIQTNQEISIMRTQMNNLEQMISGVNSNLSALTVLVERQLNSISLVPQLYINGIEAIEFTSLKYTEWVNNFATKDIEPKASKSNIISDGETEAIYRLNPTTVQLSGIDVDNIDFLAAKAEARETRAYGPMDKSPITFNGIKDYNNGLMKVAIKKTTTDFLGAEDDKDITIVALKVPRNSTLYEAADVISENSRLVERFYSPRIASLDGSGKYNKNGYRGTETYYDDVDNKTGISWNIVRPHHYEDSVSIYNSRVDLNTIDNRVAKLVYYKNTFDVKTIVTGCLLENGYNGTCQKEITPADLKKYGIAIRYALPQSYTDVTHNTDEQQFASITSNGIISPKLPDGRTDNKAIIGKEPIVRIEMVDTINNKLVDRRYLKIKWTDQKDPEQPEPPLDEIELFEKKSEAVLNPCGTVKAGNLTWKETILNIYAEMQHHSGMEGLSEDMFREIYFPNGDREVTCTWTTNWPSNYSSLTSAPNRGTDNTASPNFVETANPYGDAILASWELTADQIKTVYCSSQNDTKTFTAKVTFKPKAGSGFEKRYPPVSFKWSFTIKLPTLPAIEGFYEQYWLEGKVGQEHDILPLQYDTQLQRWWRTSGGRSYCFYDNDLMNPFVYYSVNGVPLRIVNKDIPQCGSWDIQFAYKQSIMTGYQPNYIAGDAADNSANFNTGGTDNKRIWKSGGKEVNTRNFADGPNLINWQSFGAYQMLRLPLVPAQNALQMMWLSDNYPLNGNYNGHENPNEHKAWNNSPNYPEIHTYLRADHFTGANQAFLNPLVEDASQDIVGPDGTKQPKRTHIRPIDINIWAALNAWNYIPVLSYKAYMVAPLRVNWSTLGGGNWQDGEIAGSPVSWRHLFSLTDFRGYLVADLPDGSVSSTDEQKMYTETLWKYYEVSKPIIDVKNARFAFEMKNGNIAINNNLNLKGGQGMTSAELYKITNGNIDISFEQDATGDYILFFNNGGSNVEAKVKAAMPVKVTYGFGIMESWLEGWVYPHGEKIP